MTISTTDNKVNYTADGVLTIFTFDFKVLDESHLKVLLDNVLQTLGYTVNLNPDQDNNPGGNVTFDAAPSENVIVTLLREVPLTQVVDYQPYDPFPAETHEKALDKLTMITQQNAEVSDRTVTAPPAYPDTDLELPLPDPTKVLGWSGDGKSIVNYENTEVNPGGVNSIDVYEYVATSGQTAFSGADIYGNTLEYQAKGLIVSVEGVVLDSAEYTVTSTSVLTLNTPATLNDNVRIQTFSSFNAFSEADQVSYDNSASGLSATTVQGAIDELDQAGDIGLINIQKLTASGTYTPTPGTNKIRVFITGGGGGGGTAAATGATQAASGVSGGGGGSVDSLMFTGFDATETVTIGGGGLGNTGAAGLNGGDSTFGAHFTAEGGNGGAAGNVNPSLFFLAGSSGGGGSPGAGVLHYGGSSDGSSQAGTNANAICSSSSGSGGSSYFGGGAIGVAGANTYSVPGIAAVAYGAGGSGGVAGGAGIQAIGGNGADGICIIEEYA